MYKNLLLTEKNKFNTHEKFKNISVSDFLKLIDINSYTQENEREQLILLGSFLYGSTCEGVLLSVIAERFYKSIVFCKERIDTIISKLKSLNKIELFPITKIDEFILCADSSRMYKANIVPDIAISNIPYKILYKTKKYIYEYLYNIFIKNYNKENINVFLPIIIFQSIFHKTDKLFRAVDYTFKDIKTENSILSKYENEMIKYIKEIYKSIYKENKEQIKLRDMGFEKSSGSLFYLNNIFKYTDFNHIKSQNDLYKELRTIDWYNYFIGLCMLWEKFESNQMPLEIKSDIISAETHQIINQKNIEVNISSIPNIFEMNNIAFLCLSNIFDSIFINDEYCNIKGLDSYIYPAFTWGIFKEPLKDKNNDNEKNIYFNNKEIFYYEKNYDFLMELKNKIYNFLLNYMGILEARKIFKKDSNS